MTALEELEPAVLHEGHMAARQFEFERRAVVGGAEEDGLSFQRQPRLTLAQHFVDDPARLSRLVGHGDELGPRSGCNLAPEFLGVALAGRRDHGIRGREDRGRRAVVLFERDDPRRGTELGREVEDVAHLGGPKGVDRLGIVTDHGQAPAVGPQRAQDLGLQAVGVLVLVDQHMVEACRRVGGQGRLEHGLGPVEQEIVVVEHLLAQLLVHVAAEQRLQFGFPGGAPGELRLQDLGQRQSTVDGARVDRKAGALEREAAVRLGQRSRLAGQVHQVFGVGAVEDRERLGQTDRRRPFTQQTCADGVEGAGPGQCRRALRSAEP